MNNLFLAEDLGTKIATFINNYVDIAINALKSLPWWVEALLLIALIVVIVMGVIHLITKCWKIIVVLVILGGVGAAVYFLFIKGKDTGSTAAIFNYASMLLKAIL